jgi:hypothetical protein
VIVWIGAIVILGGMTWAYINYQTSQNEIVSALGSVLNRDSI